jgi:hypothetical protein
MAGLELPNNYKKWPKIPDSFFRCLVNMEEEKKENNHILEKKNSNRDPMIVY